MSKLEPIALIFIGICNGILWAAIYYTWSASKKSKISIEKPIIAIKTNVSIQNAIDLKYVCNFCYESKLLVDDNDLTWTHHCLKIPPVENN